jgi:SOS-response transcriptional repressor LexA
LALWHPHQAATFHVRLAGDSMVNAGLFDGDIFVVDRAEQGERLSAAY